MIHLNPSPQRTIADSLLKKFPTAGTLTLAKTAYRDNPSVWSTLETARMYFRRRRGAAGVKNRDQTTDKSHFRAPRIEFRSAFDRLPVQLREFDEWDSVYFSGPLTALILSDLHIPYYDREATICALKYGKSIGVDTVLLNGDIADFFAESFWEKDPRKRDFPKEIRAVKDFLGAVRDIFPKAKIIYKLGNHEERHIRYMRVKAPELLGLAEFEIENVLDFAANDIQLVKDNRPIKIGGLNVLHGHEYRFAISNPVNAARGLFLRSKTNTVCGHFHQTSQHSARSLDQKVISTWSAGCLCDLHPEYRPINDWNHGFMVVQVDKNDAFEVGNLRILNGKAYY